MEERDDSSALRWEGGHNLCRPVSPEHYTCPQRMSPKGTHTHTHTYTPRGTGTHADMHTQMCRDKDIMFFVLLSFTHMHNLFVSYISSTLRPVVDHNTAHTAQIYTQNGRSHICQNTSSHSPLIGYKPQVSLYLLIKCRDIVPHNNIGSSGIKASGLVEWECAQKRLPDETADPNVSADFCSFFLSLSLSLSLSLHGNCESQNRWYY